MKFTFLLALLFIVLLNGCGKSATSAGTGITLSVNGAAYVGDFSNDAGTDSGQISLTLNQTEEGTVSGVVNFINSSCLVSGQVSGSASNGTYNIQVQQRTAVVSMSGTYNNSSISGSYAITGAGEGDCSNTTGSGTFSAER